MTSLVDFEALTNSDPTPSLLVTEAGAVVGANTAARQTLPAPLPERLPENIVGYVRSCAAANESTAGDVQLQTSGGHESFSCSCALVQPASPSSPALLILRLALASDSRENAERLSLALTAARMGTWTWERSSDKLTLSDRAAEIFGINNGPHLRWANVEAVIGPEEANHIRAAVLATLPAGGHFAVQYPIVRPGGTEIWVDVVGRARTGPDGQVRYTAGVVMDMTGRKQAEDQLRLLAAEVDHRAKNMLATMQAVVRMTRAETVQEFAAAITGRIFSLANTHTLIARSGWIGAELRDLLAHELAPYQTPDHSRIRLSGSNVVLGPSSAQALSMVLHELATNAAKYGSLSKSQGRVEVEWAACAGVLTLRWSEVGGPTVTPPQRQGFGSRLIHGAVRQQLNGRVNCDWRTEGLYCEISGEIGKVYSAALQRQEDAG